MKILILGGTKFVGYALVKKLAKNKTNKIDILSKNKKKIKNINKQYVCKLENKILKKKENYDLIIDFISKNKNQIDSIKKNFNFNLYIYISTLWIEKKKKYNNHYSKNYNPKFLPKITKDYITYKIKLENIIKKEFGNKSKILRLPIIFGFESPRIQYYVDRIFLNRQIIQSKNFNKIFISYCDLPGLIDFLENFIKKNKKFDKQIYYLVTRTISMKSFILMIAKRLKIKVKIFFYEKLFLLKKKYIFNDPFINEYKVNFNRKNLIILTPRICMKDLINKNIINFKKRKEIKNNLIKKEINFTNNYKTNEIKLFNK